jgi:hypothetical protein
VCGDLDVVCRSRGLCVFVAPIRRGDSQQNVGAFTAGFYLRGGFVMATKVSHFLPFERNAGG